MLTILEQLTLFISSTIEQSTLFISSTIAQLTLFISSTIEQLTLFISSTIEQSTLFISSTIEHLTLFISSTIEQSTLFISSTIEQLTLFISSTIEQLTLFISTTTHILYRLDPIEQFLICVLVCSIIVYFVYKIIRLLGNKYGVFRCVRLLLTWISSSIVFLFVFCTLYNLTPELIIVITELLTNYPNTNGIYLHDGKDTNPIGNDGPKWKKIETVLYKKSDSGNTSDDDSGSRSGSSTPKASTLNQHVPLWMLDRADPSEGKGKEPAKEPAVVDTTKPKAKADSSKVDITKGNEASNPQNPGRNPNRVILPPYAGSSRYTGWSHDTVPSAQNENAEIHRSLKRRQGYAELSSNFKRSRFEGEMNPEQGKRKGPEDNKSPMFEVFKSLNIETKYEDNYKKPEKMSQEDYGKLANVERLQKLSFENLRQQQIRERLQAEEDFNTARLEKILQHLKERSKLDPSLRGRVSHVENAISDQYGNFHRSVISRMDLEREMGLARRAWAQDPTEENERLFLIAQERVKEYDRFIAEQCKRYGFVDPKPPT